MTWNDVAEVVKVGLDLSTDVVANIGLVPGLPAVLGLASAIIEICQKLEKNKNAAKQLSELCKELSSSLGAMGDLPSSDMTDKIIKTKTELSEICDSLTHYASYSVAKQIIAQGKIADAIEAALAKVYKLNESLKISFVVDVLQWNGRFERMRECDHKEAVVHVEIMLERFDRLEVLQKELGEKIDTLIKRGSQGPPNPSEDEYARRALVQLQLELRDIMTDHDLSDKIKHGPSQPGFGNAKVSKSIYNGPNGPEAVACRSRCYDFNLRPNVLQRFIREAEIWHRVWNVDGGAHILAIYGFGLRETSCSAFAYIVNPWQSNGTVNQYIENNKYTDRRKLIKGIAQGIRVLHTMDPPIAHSGIKGENILIGHHGEPLLADFSLSKVMTDAKVVQTGTSAVDHSNRWNPPEFYAAENPDLIPASDIYMFGMTMLEILTGCAPYAEIESDRAVDSVVKAHAPERPVNPKVIRLGLNDALWELMNRCWNHPPKTRPTIQTVIAELDMIWPDV